MPRKKFNLAGLNPAQRAAVEQVEGPVLILAGAGTGKTRTVTTRIAHMVSSGICPSRILALTFTNKAANEMRERVAGMVSKEDAKKITLCTFHSLCVRILRKSIDRLGYKRNFTIYTASDQVGLVRKLIARKSGKDENLDHGLALALIGRSKNRGIPVSEGADSLVADVERAYNQELKLLNAVDFDDLLILAVKLLNEHEDIRKQWLESFRYIMIDEFQDTNGIQMELVCSLSGTEKNICVVGDDDQSIYGWRGAEISNILDFERFFPDPKVIKLEQNYRSTTPILHTANSIIRHNVGRREKVLWTDEKGSHNVRVIAMPEEEEEVQFVVDEILAVNATEKRSYDDFAVLFRTNNQSRRFELKLREHKIPYRVIGGQSFYDRREVKDLLAYLQVIANPDDDINLLRIVNNPPRGIGAATVSLANEKSREMGISIFDVMGSSDFQQMLPAKSRASVARFVALIKGCGGSMCAERARYGMLFEEVIDEIDFTGYLRRTCKTDREKEQRAENVSEFIGLLRDYERRQGRNSLQKFLDDIALQQDREEDDIEKQNGVSLITLHAAKGLEFPIVYLVGMEEGILPHKRSIDEGTRDEERRLFYVGITRAMQRLTISFCRNRVRYGEPVSCMPSTFLDELDPAYLDVSSYEELAAQPMEREQAMDYFERMKSMLGED
ncbi:MAG: UvrD-helicase domain-containing protein [Verrucomicrobiaceae bacterium]|nr:UvrD-helicase domain-containing protein [Verrucomicrobiaceae bacterium]